ncbi:MAG: T9SS type A sorting domain-containing protein [Chloroherpetonaceae bacterium]
MKTSVIICLLLHVFCALLSAQEIQQPALSEALNPDGTLKSGVEGSFNAQGFEMRLGPKGEPIFHSIETTSSTSISTTPFSWQGFGQSGDANNFVIALAVSGTDVYVGGTFITLAGNTNANRIARWDGSQWHSLGAGFNSDVNSIAISGSEVYAGGVFSASGSTPLNRIARWDGQSWNALGSGTGGVVTALAVRGRDVFVGGFFTDAGGNSDADMIARWDGTNWNALGTGLNNTVNAIRINGADVFVGGDFTDAGGNPNANRIARWNGTSWNALGTGLNNTVLAIAIRGGDVFVGGNFTDAGGNPDADRIARWNGTSWNALGTGLNSTVSTIAIQGSDVFVGGNFTDAGGNPDADRIARWNGTSWNALDVGLNNSVFAIVEYNEGIVVGGNFTATITNPFTPRLTFWNGTRWNSLGSGFNGNINCIAVSGNDVYVGGTFTQIDGNINNRRIAHWDGTRWNSLGTGMSDVVHAIAVSNGLVYVGGSFASAGGVPNTNRIAVWDGLRWNSVGTLLNNSVLAIAISGSDIYIGGFFTNAGGNPNATRIARWDGSSWQPLGTGLGGTVRAIAISGSDVYVGGDFTDAGGNPNADFVARWDGSSWNALGTGLNATVRAISVSDSNVYVGGDFIDAGSNPNADRIARWDGASWNSLGTGVNSAAFSISISGSDVYVAGNFSTAGGVSGTTGIARWNGNTWNSVGGGVSSAANAVAVSGSEVYVGGGFMRAGNVFTARFAKWNGVYTSPPLAAQQRNVSQGAGLVPFNFSEVQTGVRLSISSGGNASINVFRYSDQPIETGTLAPHIKPFRFIIQQTGLAPSFTANLRINLSQIQSNGIAIPNNAIIYRRSEIGQGQFVPLVTSVVGNELSANTTAFGEFCVAELAPPDSAVLSNITSNSFTVTWESIFPEYRVVFKTGSSPTSPNDGTILLNGAGSSATATGLSSNTPYFVAVYAKKNGVPIFSSSAHVQSVATLSTIPEQVFVLAFAAGETGEKAAGGTGVSIRLLTPSATDGFFTITRNQSVAGDFGLPLAALTASGGSVTADIVSNRWYSIQASGLLNYRYAIDFDLTALQGVNNQRTLTLLKRTNSSSAWGAAANRHRVGGASLGALDSAISSPRAGHLLVEGLRDGGEFGFGANSSDNPLPVSLVAFDGNPLAQGIRLNWITASEIDNAGFVVLRDGVEIASFANSDALRGRGTTTEMSRYEFIDKSVQKETEYTYKLRSIDLGGFVHEYERKVQMGLFDYHLAQNYPNPFNPVTTIEFTLRSNVKAKLQIFDVLGRVVKSQLIDGKVGMNRYVFNASGLASGVYFYRIEAGGGVGEASFVATKKMLLVK